MNVNEMLLQPLKKTKGGPKQQAYLKQQAQGSKPVLPSNALELAPLETQKIIVALMLNGEAMSEIAERVGLSPNKLTRLRGCQDFRDLLVSEATQRGTQSIQKLLKSALPELVFDMINIATDPKQTAKLRAEVAFNLMDRALGRPVAGKPLDTNVDDERITADPIEENAQLEREIESLKSQLNPTHG